MSAGSIELGGAEAGESARSRPSRAKQLVLDRFELVVLAAFIGISVWVLGADLWRVVAQGRVWTDTDGLFLADQMQYLAWIRSAAAHGLSSDLFVLHDTSSDYLQPLVILSAALARLGVAVWLTLLLWKPVAVLAMFYATRAYVRGNLAGIGARRAALVIALFGGSLPAFGDLWVGFWSWGYSFPLIGIAALVGAIPAYEAARNGRVGLWLPASLGALASWLHPWQGEALVLIVLGAESLLWLRDGRAAPGRRRLALAAVTVAATAGPLVYYAILTRADPQWGMARDAGKHMFQLSMAALALAPLLLASALAYRRWPRGFVPTATRLWLPAAAAIFFLSESGFSATPLHAFAGISVPLGVLSVEGALSLGASQLRRRPLLAALLVAAVTVPATFAQLRNALVYLMPAPANANFISRDERRALDFLAYDPAAGGVLSRAYLSLITPALTGRHAYLGTCYWSEPSCTVRQELVHRVFLTSGIPDRVVRAEVLSTHARFVLNSTCSLPGKDLDDVLAPVTAEVHRFGCATLYVLR